MCNIVLVKFIRGSRAYGTFNENSDTDTTTIYLEDIYEKATIFKEYKHSERFKIEDNSKIELGLLIDRIFKGDTAFLENCFKDLVIEETPYTKLYFQMMEDLIRADLFNENVLKSRAKKHFRDETKRVSKILRYAENCNIENNQALLKAKKLLYQNLRIELLLNSILEGNPELKYTGNKLDYLKSIKYGNLTIEDVREKMEDFNKRWDNNIVKYDSKERDILLDKIYISYLKRFDKLKKELS